LSMRMRDPDTCFGVIRIQLRFNFVTRVPMEPVPGCAVPLERDHERAVVRAPRPLGLDASVGRRVEVCQMQFGVSLSAVPLCQPIQPCPGERPPLPVEPPIGQLLELIETRCDIEWVECVSHTSIVRTENVDRVRRWASRAPLWALSRWGLRWG